MRHTKYPVVKRGRQKGKSLYPVRSVGSSAKRKAGAEPHSIFAMRIRRERVYCFQRIADEWAGKDRGDDEEVAEVTEDMVRDAVRAYVEEQNFLTNDDDIPF